MPDFGAMPDWQKTARGQDWEQEQALELVLLKGPQTALLIMDHHYGKL